MGMNVKTNRITDLRQSIEDVEGDKYLIADAADIDDDFSRQLVRQSSANLRNHGGS
jgi:hypothetical protein